jgi:hypothetical protein
MSGWLRSRLTRRACTEEAPVHRSLQRKPGVGDG